MHELVKIRTARHAFSVSIPEDLFYAGNSWKGARRAKPPLESVNPWPTGEDISRTKQKGQTNGGRNRPEKNARTDLYAAERMRAGQISIAKLTNAYAGLD
jgi:hypothetical protein